MHGRHSVINSKIIPKPPGTDMTSLYWYENCTVAVVILGTENYMLAFSLENLLFYQTFVMDLEKHIWSIWYSICFQNKVFWAKHSI